MNPKHLPTEAQKQEDLERQKRQKQGAQATNPSTEGLSSPEEILERGKRLLGRIVDVEL